jgi:hypothetical protein
MKLRHASLANEEYAGQVLLERSTELFGIRHEGRKTKS